jgi:hypothetical protein
MSNLHELTGYGRTTGMTATQYLEPIFLIGTEHVIAGA